MICILTRLLQFKSVYLKINVLSHASKIKLCPPDTRTDSTASKDERLVHGGNLVDKILQLNRKLAWMMAELGIEVCLCGNTEPT